MKITLNKKEVQLANYLFSSLEKLSVDEQKEFAIFMQGYKFAKESEKKQPKAKQPA